MKVSTLEPTSKEVLPPSRGLSKGDYRVVKRTSSCPPGRGRSTSSGPWSLEFVNRCKQNDTGVPLKTKHNDSASCYVNVPNNVTKKKGRGSLRHCAQKLKRIARLSNKDRKEVLRALQRSSKQHKAVPNASKATAQSKEGSFTGESQNSVNNEWQNWLTLHGNATAISKDVCDIGKAVGLSFKGDKNNMFDVLFGVGRKIDGGSGNGN